MGTEDFNKQMKLLQFNVTELSFYLLDEYNNQLFWYSPINNNKCAASQVKRIWGIDYFDQRVYFKKKLTTY